MIVLMVLSTEKLALEHDKVDAACCCLGAVDNQSMQRFQFMEPLPMVPRMMPTWLRLKMQGQGATMKSNRVPEVVQTMIRWFAAMLAMKMGVQVRQPYGWYLRKTVMM